MTSGEFRGQVWVHYGQIELEADEPGELPDWGDFFRHSLVGLIGTQPGHAIMLTGLHTGTVTFTVVVADQDPGAALDDYDDVVEIDLEARSDQIRLVEWGEEATHELPPLPAGPSAYRLRYHARGMDAAAQADTNLGEQPMDEYLLQIWPAVPTAPASVKITSDQARYWQADKR